ncbi:AraC family transcriptional regulator [Paenibacillus hodogayensis]|uniref:AraC family transcriptional regulator n=1 Tax=Paenibacillus hodogayensis TaxID=279208 RepID=A0ABV5VRS6_9BACL
MHTSYGFQRGEHVSERLYAIESIGCGVALDGSYGQDGMRRPGGGHLFQYTLSGEGAIAIGGETYTLPKHHGFFVTIPSEHRYFYPPNGQKPWEFIWIRSTGGETASYWQHFIRSFGAVASFREDSEPIRLMWSMYRDAAEQEFRDKYRMSLRLFEWIMALERLAEGRDRIAEPMPESLQTAKRYMERHLGVPVSLDDIAASAGLSKHHFCKVFKMYTGISPVHYLRKIRVEEAARLLRNTALPVEDISRRLAFDNVSYFGKVFRQYAGASPTDYRKGLNDLHDHRHLQIID